MRDRLSKVYICTMARRSQFEHLKPQILAEFQAGLQPKDLYEKFPQIPGATIREWFKPFRANSAPDSANSASGSESSVRQLHPPTKRSPLTVVGKEPREAEDDESSLSDLQWVKRKIKNILRAENNNAIKVQALNTYLRAVQIESAMPPTKPEVDLSELSDQELERLAAGEALEASARAE